MTRRPRRGRPPRLPDPEPPRPRRDTPAPASPRARLLAARVCGPHARLGRAEAEHLLARLVAGAPDARCGLDLGSVTRDEARAAVAQEWGWASDTARAAIAPDRTVAGAEAAASRLRAVAAAGGRVAVASGRPASLLSLCQAVAAAAAGAGAEVVDCDRYGPFAPDGRALWWHDGVAVVTDGDDILADDGVDAGPEWLFAIGRPDLVIADHGFAGAALAAGHETVALADLDAVALGIAARRGWPVRLVPLDDGCAPAAYEPLVELLTAVPVEAREPGEVPEGHEPAVGPQPAVEAQGHHREDHAQGSHSTTRAPALYVEPESGGEG